MEEIGLKAILEDEDFQKGVASILKATQNLVSGQEQAATKLDQLDQKRRASAKQTAEAEKTAFDSVKAGLSNFADTLNGIGGKVGKFAKVMISNYMNISNMAKDVYQVMVDAWAFAEEGAQLDLASIKFDRFARTLGSTGDVMLGKLHRATQGMMSDAEMMQTAGDVMSLGLVKTEDQAIRLTGAVSALGADMNQVVLTLANRTTMRFDQIGIAIDGFDEKLKVLEATGMSTNDAFTEAFLQQAEAQIGKAGSVAETAAGQMMIFDASVKNLKDSLKVSAAEGLLPFIQKMNETIERNKAYQAVMETNMLTTEEARAAYLALTIGVGDIDKAMEPVNAAIDQMSYLELIAASNAEDWDKQNIEVTDNLKKETDTIVYGYQQMGYYKEHTWTAAQALEYFEEEAEKSSHKVGSLNIAIQNQTKSLKEQIAFLSAGGGLLLDAQAAILDAFNKNEIGAVAATTALDAVAVSAIDLQMELDQLTPEEAAQQLETLGYGPEEAKEIVKKLQDSLYSMTSQEYIINIITNLEGGTLTPTSVGKGGSGGGGGTGSGSDIGEENPGQLSAGPRFQLGVDIVPVYDPLWDDMPRQFDKVGYDIGKALVENIGGELEGLLDAGGTLSSILGGFGGMFEDQILDPMNEQLDTYDDQLDSINDLIAAKKEEYFGEISEIELAKIKQQYLRDASSLTEEQRNKVIHLMALERERNALMGQRNQLGEDYAAEEERILKLQEQQQQLKFLEQQMEMLDFLKEHGLNPAEVLGGMKLGLDASLPDLIDAMSKAMGAIIDAANEELEIGSPSKVMQRIADNLMGSFGSQLVTSASDPIGAMQDVMSGVSTMAMAATSAPLAYTNVSRTANISFGDTNLSGGIDVAVLESVMRSLIRSELGVAL